MQRKKWLDIIKGIAIICVVLQHSLQRTMSYFDLGNGDFFDIMNRFVNSVNMQWFFVVSGFIYMMKRETYLANSLTFVKNKFVDLMIPYIILGPLIWFGKFVFSAYVNKPVDFSNLIDMFISPVAFMWFIYVLFIIEVLVLLIDKYLKIKYEIVLGLLFIIHIILYKTTGKGTDIMHMVPYFLFWYYFGGFFVLFMNTIQRYHRRIMYLGGWVWLIGFLLKISFGLSLIGVIYTLGSVFFIFLFFMYYEKENSFTSLMNYFGGKTMYLYILNPIIINGLRVILQRLGMNDVILNLFVFFLGALLIGCMIAKVANKFPILEFVFLPRKYLKKYI